MQESTAKADKAADALLPAGTLFGKYQIVRSIGVGGMGAVYEATHTLLKKPVALKTLHAVLATHDDHRTRFLREGEAVARIRHPNVVDVSDVGVQDGIPFLVMELLHGEDLHALLRREGPLDEKRAATLLLPVADGLGAAHAAGVVHRDLKPENIFLARDGKGELRPKLLDFGISKVSGLDGGFAVTSAGALLGTPYYMSPEQAEGGTAVGAPSDQYALGVILYECVTGRLPFFQERLLDLLNAIAQGVFQMPAIVNPALDPNFENIILRAMATSPDNRFPNVEELGRALLPYASSRVRAEYGPSLGVPADGESSYPPPLVRTSSPGDPVPGRRVSSSDGATSRPASASGSGPRARSGSAPNARTSSLPTETGARTASKPGANADTLPAPPLVVEHSQSTPPPERRALETPPSRRGLWVGAVVVALLLVAVAWLAWNGSSQPAAPIARRPSVPVVTPTPTLAAPVVPSPPPTPPVVAPPPDVRPTLAPPVTTPSHPPRHPHTPHGTGTPSTPPDDIRLNR